MTQQYALIKQEDEWGCGAACVASLLGISYREAKNLVEEVKGSSVNAPPHGLELHHLALALWKKRVKVVADWNPKEIPHGTIVCISGDAPYDGDHYMLKTPFGWMDPWYNIGTLPRKANFRQSYPGGTEFLVALIPQGTG
ncbi:MAG TPA: hypothetical protein PK027_02880 [Aquimonas sp.]|jgi:hypothetical protein|nr:hypothetical protein [Aquimonas sp.]